jgi:hypothetical protein
MTMHAVGDEVSPSSLSPRIVPQPSTGTAGPSGKPRSDAENAYQAIAGNPQYKHFINIPTRIIRCLDYFGVAGNRELIKSRLQSYYLFIGVVDNALDSNQIEIGVRVLEYLDAGFPALPEVDRQSELGLVTTALRFHIHDDRLVNEFHKLYREVLSERVATSIETYMTSRTAVGSLTAELSYLFIKPLLKEASDNLCRFMKEVGEVGCLVDSLIDLRSDHRLGLLAFTPVAFDYLKLLLNSLRRGLLLSIRYPGLCFLFLQAIVDILQEPINQPLSDRRLTANRKDRAASVA